MKKLFAILLILCVLAFPVATFTALAEPEEEPEVVEEEIVEEPAEETDESELKDKLAVAIAKLNEYTGEDSFFKNKVLPLIISNGSTLLLFGALFLRTYLKKKSKAEALETLAASLQNENANLNTLLSSTDVGKIKEALISLLDGHIDKLLGEVEEKIKGYMDGFLSIKTTVDTEYAQLKALAEAARLAWSSKPEVVELLAISPEKSTLENQAQVIEALKNIIYQCKGAEAENLIKEVGA